MEFFKKHWQNILIAALIVFSMNKCTSSCTNAHKFKEAEQANVELIAQRDSIVKVYDDSVKSLNMQLQVMSATISGNKEMIDRLSQANEQISAAKKNINVNVRNTK